MHVAQAGVEGGPREALELLQGRRLLQRRALHQQRVEAGETLLGTVGLEVVEGALELNEERGVQKADLGAERLFRQRLRAVLSVS